MKHGRSAWRAAGFAAYFASAAVLVPGVATADETDPPAGATGEAPSPAAEETPEPEAARKLPFLAEAARERGYELPLPFGGALVLTTLSGRKIDVTDVRVGVGGDPSSVSRFVDLGSTSDVFNANLKFDAWILPFLNVYALVGYVYNESTTHAVVTLPRPGPIPGEIVEETEVTTELDGFLGGGGIVLAGGFRDFFFVGDFTYARTDLGFDDDFTAVIATVRAGWNGHLGRYPAQIWAGVGNWDTAATASGQATLDDGRLLDFEADQEPETPWMYDVGTQVEFSKRWQLVVDVGHDFDGGWLFVLGPTYRW